MTTSFEASSPKGTRIVWRNTGTDELRPRFQLEQPNIGFIVGNSHSSTEADRCTLILPDRHSEERGAHPF
jgi:hypothetical protein